MLMDGAENVELPADGSAGAQSSDGLGGQSLDSSQSGAWSFDFTLTGPMWGEFVEAANAYGRGLRRIFLPFVVFFGALCLMIVGVMRSRFFGDNESVKLFAGLFAFMVLTLLFCWGRLDSLVVLRAMFRSVSDWFAVPSTSTAELTRVFATWRYKSFDARWLTPCRLWVDDAGVVLLHRVNGEEFATRAAWSDLACVRLTEHAVVLSPSAGGKASMDIIPAVAEVRFADVDGCVLVDRSVMPDVDGFVAWCRSRIASAAVPLPSRGLRAWVRRFWSWLYGDREFLDCPPAWAANK
ncbi:hypothetical protein OZX62_07460 [Bifidobacterium sp. ESL0690]|uniref:hypothetical protein n=1 Tax=Bifidobacterium sp. ESL0690 TaxID=2983214 RepID=UPI0023F6EB87|nr:hypothetical protein [Bifidobacterium sp. ESL0690]WEV46275.1 hypothetical protein OZX62_07460 [Bifidobacterium sp. ESL0690]